MPIFYNTTSFSNCISRNSRIIKIGEGIINSSCLWFFGAGSPLRFMLTRTLQVISMCYICLCSHTYLGFDGIYRSRIGCRCIWWAFVHWLMTSLCISSIYTAVLSHSLNQFSFWSGHMTTISHVRTRYKGEKKLTSQWLFDTPCTHLWMKVPVNQQKWGLRSNPYWVW